MDETTQPVDEVLPDGPGEPATEYSVLPEGGGVSAMISALGGPLSASMTQIPAQDFLDDGARSPTVIDDSDNAMLYRVYPLLAPPEYQPIQEALDTVIDMAGQNYMSLGDEYDSSSVADIPETLNEIVQTISRATGAMMYVIAMWDDGKDGTTLYETCSNRVSEFVREDHSLRARQRFGNFVHHLLGPAFTRSRYRTWPTVYGLAQFDYRPRLPPEHPDIEQERHALFVWFSKLACWQGLKAIIDWKAVTADISSKTFVMVERLRLPSVEINSDPSGWSPEVVRAIALHIRSHQDRFDAGDLSAQLTAFQWKEGPDHTVFRTTIHDSSTLVYTEDATAYMSAMARHNFRPYAYLPLTAAARPSIFTTEARRLIAEAEHLDATIAPLVPLIDAHERSDAPLGAAAPDDPLIMSDVPAIEHDIASCLRDFLLPEEFASYASSLHPHWSAGRLFSYVYNGGLHDDGGRLKRGWGGVLRVFLAAIRGYRTIEHLIAQNKAGKRGRFDDEFKESDYRPLQDTLGWLKDALEQELENKKPLDHIELPVGTWNTPWAPSQLDYSTGFGHHASETWKPRKPGYLGAQPIDPGASPIPSSSNLPLVPTDPEARAADQMVIDLSTPPASASAALTPAQETAPQVIPTPFQLSDLYEQDNAAGSKGRGTRTEVKQPVPLPPASDSTRTRRSLSAPLEIDHSENALGLNIPAPPSRENSPELLAHFSLNRLTTPSFRAPVAASTPTTSTGAPGPVVVSAPIASSTPFGRGRTLVKSPPPPDAGVAITGSGNVATVSTQPGARATTVPPTVGAPQVEQTASDLGRTIAGRAAYRNMRATSVSGSPNMQVASAFPTSSARPVANLVVPRRSAPKRAVSKRALPEDEESETSSKRRSASGSGSRSKR